MTINNGNVETSWCVHDRQQQYLVTRIRFDDVTLCGPFPDNSLLDTDFKDQGRGGAELLDLV